jgi:hypothetical protein
VVRRQLGKGDKNKIRGIYNRAASWAERVRLMQHWSDRLDRLRDGARRLAAQIGGLACSRFDPRQRSVIFIHAVEVDHGLATGLMAEIPRFLRHCTIQLRLKSAMPFDN